MREESREGKGKDLLLRGFLRAIAPSCSLRHAACVILVKTERPGATCAGASVLLLCGGVTSAAGRGTRRGGRARRCRRAFAGRGGRPGRPAAVPACSAAAG